MSKSALATLRGLVGTQATVLAYADANRASALVTLLLTPLVLVLKKPSRQANVVAE